MRFFGESARLKAEASGSPAIFTVSTKLSKTERDRLLARSGEQQTTPSEYLRRLIREDHQRFESEALLALSLDDLARGQQEHGRQLHALQRDLPSAMLAIAGQLNGIVNQLEKSAESGQQHARQLLDAYHGTADLVVAALDECQTILDADNTILENIERRLRAGGK